MIRSIITGTGSYISEKKIENRHFSGNEFYDEQGRKLDRSNEDIIRKLKEITCIEERRYIPDDLKTSDMAHIAGRLALENTDMETLDFIIVAHNFGDVRSGGTRADMVPSIAARVKHKLAIKNPYTVAFDIPFGCPGWIQGMILADYYIKSGEFKKILVIGAETLSRVCDPHDIDSMIYADGAGATLVEATQKDAGILSHATRSDTLDKAFLLWLDTSYSPHHQGDDLFIKMHGHEIYKYAVKTVPEVVKLCLDKLGMTLSDIRKILVHQANQKMDEAILKRLFSLYQEKKIPDHIMPMTIATLGNSSVATLPTLFDLIKRGRLENQKLRSKDIVVFASVGAGMNTNAMVYRMP
jgi:3-oxoacyl-[acyl-carrier-protein] synthase III